VIEGEVAIRAGRPPAAVPVLAHVDDELPEPFVGYYQVERLIELGFARQAPGLLQCYGPRLGESDTFALRLAATFALGQSSQLIDALNHKILNGKAVELIAACLIRRPDPAVLAAFQAAVLRSNLPRTAENLPAYGALFCACGVAHDWARLDATGEILRAIRGGRFTTLGVLKAFFRGDSGASRPGTFLPLLQPLSVDVMYAIFDCPSLKTNDLHPPAG
jgi:hypothetical protein